MKYQSKVEIWQGRICSDDEDDINKWILENEQEGWELVSITPQIRGVEGENGVFDHPESSHFSNFYLTVTDCNIFHFKKEVE